MRYRPTAVLGPDSIAATGDVPEHVPLEVGVEARLLLGGLVHPVRVLAVPDELATHVVGVQLVERDRPDAPELVLGPAGRDVEPLPVRLLRHGPDAASLAGRDDQGEEHDAALVALEVIGVAAADPAAFHLLLAQTLDELALDELGLRRRRAAR